MSPILFFGLFAAWSALMAIYPVFPPIARQLGLSEIQAGVLISVSAFLMVLASPVWGDLSERWGRKTVFLVGLFGAGVTIMAFAMILQLGLDGLVEGTALFLLLVLVRLPLGLLVAAAPIAAQAYVADTTDAGNRAAGMARLGAANALGLIVGPALATFLVAFGLLVPFYGAAILVIAVALVVMIAMPHAPRRAAPAKIMLRPWERRIRPFLLIGLVAVMLISLVQISIGFFLMDRFALSIAAAAQSSAIAFFVVGAALVLVQGMLIPRLNWAPVYLLRTGLPMMAAGCALLLMAPAIWVVYAAFIVMGMGAGMTFPGYQAAITLVVDESEQGAVAGLTGAANAAGAVVGPLAGTALYQLSPGAPYLTAVVLLGALAAFVWLNRQVGVVSTTR